jgi:phage terminase large subunit-like protein
MSGVLGFHNNWHQDLWCDILDNKVVQDRETGKLKWNTDPNRINRKIIILSPRSSAKSTHFSVNHPLTEITRNKNHRVTLISSSSENSESFLRETKGHIEREDPNRVVDYRKVHGNIKPANPERWTDSMIFVERTNLRLKDPTIAAVGAEGSILSRRSDEIISDDILNQKNSRTPEQRIKVKDWYNNILKPILVPGGREVVVGTIQDDQDLYSELMEDTTFDIRLRMQAILIEKYIDYIPDDEEEAAEWAKENYLLEIMEPDLIEHYGVDLKCPVLWPEVWPLEELLARKGETPSQNVAFYKQYQNKIVSGPDAIFQKEYLDKAKEAGKDYRLLNYYNPSQWTLGPNIRVQGHDLAIGENEESGYTTGAVIAGLRDGRRIILRLWSKRLSPSKTRQAIVSDWQKFNTAQVKVESNAYQASLKHDLKEFSSIPIKGYNTGGEKFDEFIGLNSVATEIENGKWIFPYDKNDPYTKQMINILVDEMLKFGAGHTGDLLMALWFADIALRELEIKGGKMTTVSSVGMYKNTTPN